MSVGIRFFLVDANESVTPVSHAKFDRLWYGDEPLPAGIAGLPRQPYVEVYVATANRRPVELLTARCYSLVVGPNGRHDFRAKCAEAAVRLNRGGLPAPWLEPSNKALAQIEHMLGLPK